VSTFRILIRRHPLLTYFILTFAISWGGILLVIGGPGAIPTPSEQAMKLLMVAIMVMVLGPSVAGILLTGIVYVRVGFRKFLSRLLRWRVHARWYVVAILKRQAVQEKLRRMAKAYIDGVFPDEEYQRQKKLLELELESLVVSAADAATEAGKLILDLPKLWTEANLEERRKLLLSMLDAVYVDAKKMKSIVAIRPKPPFKPVFQVAASREGSGIRIINEPLEGSSVDLE
jgi:hypothetical protein